ncbi:RidA family protein [Streptomyces sp. NPDC002845]
MSEPTRIPTPDGVAPAAGATFDDVVKLTCFVTDMAHMPAIRAARAEHIGTYPTTASRPRPRSRSPRWSGPSSSWRSRRTPSFPPGAELRVVHATQPALPA